MTEVFFNDAFTEDLEKRCAGVPDPVNTTCSWRGLDLEPDTVTPDQLHGWFRHCACWMLMHAAGP
jgi:hypothetical protein